MSGELAFQMRVQMADDIVCQRPHKWQLVPSAQSGQLEGAEAHKGGRHAAHHSSRLILCIATARHQMCCW